MSFPSTFSHIATDTLLDVFSRAPKRLRQSIVGLNPEEMRARPRGRGWSIQEIVLHVVDAEVVGHFRILSVLGSGEKTPSLAAYDQNDWTSSFDYHERTGADVRDALRYFSVTRETETALLRRLDEEHWNRSGIHGEWGSITLRQILELYADHPERHLDQIVASREALGKPVSHSNLLGEWLYGSRA